MLRKFRPVRNLSIRHQLILILFFIIIVLVLLMNFNFFYNSSIVERKMVDFSNQINTQVGERLDSFIKTDDVYMRAFIHNLKLQEYLEQAREKGFDQVEHKELLSELKRTAVRHMLSNGNVYDIIISDIQGNMLFYYCTEQNVRRLERTIRDLSTGIIFDNSNYMYTVSKPVHTGVGPQIGTVTFVFYISSLNEVFGEQMKIGDIRYFLLNDERHIIAGPDGIRIGQQADNQILTAASDPGRQWKDKFDGSDVLISGISVEGREWSIVGVVPIDELMYGVLQIRYSTILIWLACILLIIVIYGLFLKKLSRSVGHLLSIMKSVQLGDFQIRAKPLQNRELNLLSLGFNRMMDRIVELTGENYTYQQELYEVEISNRQAKLKALQSQINPHFLYNTLEIMRSIGVYHDIKEIQEIATSLAYMFKYSIKEGNLVRVSEEMETVMRYLSIQRVRFMDKIEADIHIERTIHDAVMLKFLFQPIVENAIFHGLEQKTGKGYIRIHAVQSEEVMTFTIEDNGIGMEETALQRIRESFESSEPAGLQQPMESRGMGLVNIHHRIRLFYGNEYGLAIESKPDIGTRVTIKIPTISEEDHHVSSDDRRR